jgi:hypothetical protein
MNPFRYLGRAIDRYLRRWRRTEIKADELYRRRVHYSGVQIADSQEEARDLAARDHALVIIRGTDHPKWVVMSCPCGCGEIRRVSVSPKIQPTWRMGLNDDHELSLYPSVWLQSECGAHYILRDNVAVLI